MLPEATARPRAGAVLFLAGWVALLLLLEAGGFLYTRNPHHWNDFRSYYTAGLIARTAPHRLYDTAFEGALQDRVVGKGFLIPFLHPPFEAALYAPLSLLPFRAAYLAFIAADCCLLAALFFLTRPLFWERIPWLQSHPGLMLLYYSAVPAVMLWGQDSLLFLFCCALAWRFLSRNEGLMAGVMLGLALFRFQLALPLAVLLIVRCGKRFAAGFGLAAIVLAGLSYAIAGHDAVVRYAHLLGSASLLHDNSVAAQHAAGARPGAMPNLEGLLYVAGGRFLAPHPAFALTLAVSAALFAYGLYRMRAERVDDVAFAIAVLIAALVSYHFYAYDMTVVILPVVLLARRLPTWGLLGLFWCPLVMLIVLGPRGLVLNSVLLLGAVFLASKQRAVAAI